MKTLDFGSVGGGVLGWKRGIWGAKFWGEKWDFGSGFGVKSRILGQSFGVKKRDLGSKVLG